MAFDPLGQSGVQPLGEPHRQRRDDDLIEALWIPGLDRRGQWVGGPDGASGFQPGGAKLRHRVFERLLGGRAAFPRRTGRHDEVDCRRIALGALAQCVQERLRTRGHVGHDENVPLPGHGYLRGYQVCLT